MTDVFTHPWMRGLFGGDALDHTLGADQQFRDIIAVERAYTEAMRTCGTVTPEDAAEVIAALEAASPDDDALRAGVAHDGLVVPALIAGLKRGLSPGAQDALHNGLTSQDVIDTALALRLKAVLETFDQRIIVLDAALSSLVRTHGTNALMGRTRMQAALPITVKDRVDTWQLPLATHPDRLAAIMLRVAVLSVGGPVGTRPIDDIARHMAAALDLGLPPKAPHAMRDHLAELAGWLSLVTGTLGKMGQDITLMAQQGIEEVALTGGGTSSAMAHKNNPIRAELLVTLARFNATQLAGMHQALIHEQERSGQAWALEWMLLPLMLRATGGALRNAALLVADIEMIGRAPDR